MTVRRTIVVAVALIAVAVLALAVVFLPPLPDYVTDESQFCCRCSLRRSVSIQGYIEDGVWSVQRVREKEVEDTPLSEWYAAHFDDPCEHEWTGGTAVTRMYSSIAGVLPWNTGIIHIDGRGPGIFADLPDDVRSLLEAKYNASRLDCRDFIRQKLKAPRYLRDDTRPER